MKCVSALQAGILLLSLSNFVYAQSGTQSARSLEPLFYTRPRPSSSPDSPGLPRWVVKPASEETLRSCCEKCKDDKRRIYYLNARNGRMGMQLMGVYTREGTIFFRIFLRNHSHLDYDADSIRFYVTDKGKPKMAGGKPLQLSPVYVFGNTKIIRGKSREFAVIALPRFTLPAGKRLVIQVLERNGGRHLQLEADNFTLEKARLI
jgi:hypothetical protein